MKHKKYRMRKIVKKRAEKRYKTAPPAEKKASNTFWLKSYKEAQERKKIVYDGQLDKQGNDIIDTIDDLS